MNIDNARNEIREDIDAMTTSANRFAIIVVSTFLLALLAFLLGRTFFTGIVHVVE